MFKLKKSLIQRSGRYTIYQPQHYALYVVGKWLGICGSALLLFSLTIKWYFLLNEDRASLFNILVWCLISASILIFAIGAAFVIGLHWWVEKIFQKTQNEHLEKTQIKFSDEQISQLKRLRKPSWFKKSFCKKNQQSFNGGKKNKNQEKLFNKDLYVLENDSLVDFNSINNDKSLTGKKLIRSNSKFGTMSCLPIIDEVSNRNNLIFKKKDEDDLNEIRVDIDYCSNQNLNDEEKNSLKSDLSNNQNQVILNNLEEKDNLSNSKSLSVPEEITIQNTILEKSKLINLNNSSSQNYTTVYNNSTNSQLITNESSTGNTTFNSLKTEPKQNFN